MLELGAKKTVVLSLAGHDPSGGAGIQADIETIASFRAIPATVVTSLTAQNTKLFHGHYPQSPDDFTAQVQLVLDDMAVAGCKIGALGDAKLVDATARLITDKNFPIVLDPVLCSTTGYNFADHDLSKQIATKLLPITTVVTPNLSEAKQLSGESNLRLIAKKLLQYGCQAVLITDVYDTDDKIVNHLYHGDEFDEFVWQRLPGYYHGSGCTLSSAIATLLAKGNCLNVAIQQAQQYTWKTLQHALQIGEKQRHPNRFYWNTGDQKIP